MNNIINNSFIKKYTLKTKQYKNSRDFLVVLIETKKSKPFRYSLIYFLSKT